VGRDRQGEGTVVVLEQAVEAPSHAIVIERSDLPLGEPEQVGDVPRRPLADAVERLAGQEEVLEQDQETGGRIDAASAVANCLIFHNVQAQTRVLHQLADGGHEFDESTLSRLSPYLTEHVNRFGKYTLNLDRTNPAPDYTLSPRAVPQPVLASVSL
jgi:hypothetical protein